MGSLAFYISNTPTGCSLPAESLFSKRIKTTYIELRKWLSLRFPKRNSFIFYTKRFVCVSNFLRGEQTKTKKKYI